MKSRRCPASEVKGKPMGMTDTCVILGFFPKVDEEQEQGPLISVGGGRAPKIPVMRQRDSLQLERMGAIISIFLELKENTLLLQAASVWMLTKQ